MLNLAQEVRVTLTYPFNKDIPMYVVYGTEVCPFCHRAKALLESKELNYEYIDVSESVDAKMMFREKGLRTVPQVFIEDKLIGGFTDLVSHFR